MFLGSRDEGAASGTLLAGVKAVDAEALERLTTASEEAAGVVMTVVDAISSPLRQRTRRQLESDFKKCDGTLPSEWALLDVVVAGCALANWTERKG